MKAGDNKEFWQRTAKSYRPLMKHSGKLYDAICERIRPGLTREMNVLELACGSGQLSFRLAGRVRLWEAMDFSENMIAEESRPSNPPQYQSPIALHTEYAMFQNSPMFLPPYYHIVSAQIDKVYVVDAVRVELDKKKRCFYMIKPPFWLGTEV